MTEIPEHLLRRSRERKAALQGETPPDAGAPAGESSSASSAVEPADAATPAPQGGGRSPVPPAAPAYTGPPQPPPRKARIPMWAMPVVAGIPFWAMLYAGAFGERHVEASGPLARGAAIYAGQGCGGCHGPRGQGGVGPAMTGVHETFPEFADHVAWVKSGSAPFKGQPYGAKGRIATGGMPGFDLPEEDLIAVTCYERVALGGQNPPPPECEEGGPDAGEGTGSGAETDGGGEGDHGVTAGGEGGG